MWCCPCGIVTLNLENGSSVNDNFDATDLRFLIRELSLS